MMYEIRCEQCGAKLAETEKNPDEVKYQISIKCKKCKKVNNV